MKPGLSFSFAKKAEPKRVVESLKEKKNDGRVAIVGLEAGKVEVDGPVEEAKKLTIACKNPLEDKAAVKEAAAAAAKAKAEAPPAKKRILGEFGDEPQEGGLLARNASKLSDEDKEALQALCTGTGGEESGGISLPAQPILMRPGSKKAREGSAPEATKDMFDRVAVESFGEALLRGMGYDPKKHETKPVYFDKIRDHCLGLGATPLLPSEKAGKPKAGTLAAAAAAKRKAREAATAKGIAAEVEEAEEAEDAMNQALQQHEDVAKPKDEAPAPPSEKRRKVDEAPAPSVATGTSSSSQASRPAKEPSDGVSWPSRGLVVKVVSRDKKFREFRGCEAVVLEVDGEGLCRVKARLSDKSHVLQGVPESDLDTIVSAESTAVRVIRGPRRGTDAKLLRISDRRGVAKLRISGGEEVEMALSEICECMPPKK